MLEDTALDGKLYRTPGLLALLPTLSYSVITPPANGEVEILCGREAANASSCAYAAGNAFSGTPDADFSGNDTFVFESSTDPRARSERGDHHRAPGERRACCRTRASRRP